VVVAVRLDHLPAAVVQAVVVRHICQVRLLRVRRDKVLRGGLAHQVVRLVEVVAVRVLLVRQAF
jgi:hypothetical protein